MARPLVLLVGRQLLQEVLSARWALRILLQRWRFSCCRLPLLLCYWLLLVGTLCWSSKARWAEGWACPNLQRTGWLCQRRRCR